VRQVTENLCKLVTVTGHTKSGKTVLVRKILPREDALWIDGGGVGAEEDFWNTVIDQLELFQTTNAETNQGTNAQFGVGAKAGANLFVARGEAQGSASIGSTRGKREGSTRTVSSKVTALAGLRKAKLPVVVDDFASCNETVDGFRCHRSKCFPPGRSKIDGTTLPVFSDAAAIHGQSEKLVVLIERSELIWSWR
jgi:hypothetical protein